ncbi:Uncharacterised protein [Mycobacteroides abscessus subsp. abscessus]|nr:Uncharacterised protein [Mycobacteroides abscessus subsp. abscessus]
MSGRPSVEQTRCRPLFGQRGVEPLGGDADAPQRRQVRWCLRECAAHLRRRDLSPMFERCDFVDGARRTAEFGGVRVGETLHLALE